MWEYKVYSFGYQNDNELSRKMSVFGAEGWELVQFDLDKRVGIFKRMKDGTSNSIRIGDASNVHIQQGNR